MNRFRDPQTSGAYTPEYHGLFGSSTWITLKNVSPLLNEGDLVSVFSQFGVVVNVVIPRTAPHRAKENNILLTTAAGGGGGGDQHHHRSSTANSLNGIKRGREGGVEGGGDHHHHHQPPTELTLPQRNTLYFIEFELVGSAIVAADCMNSCPPIHTLPANQQKQLKALQTATSHHCPTSGPHQVRPQIRRPQPTTSSSLSSADAAAVATLPAIQSAHHNLAGPFRTLLLPDHDTVGLVVDRCTIKEVPVHDKISSKAALVPLLSASSSNNHNHLSIGAGAAGGNTGNSSGHRSSTAGGGSLPSHHRPDHGGGGSSHHPSSGRGGGGRHQGESSSSSLGGGVYPTFPEWTLAQLAARQKKLRASMTA